MAMVNAPPLSDNKTDRILSLYSRLINGESIIKNDEAKHFGVHSKTIQRDIDDIRAYLDKELLESGADKQLIYDRLNNAYYIKSNDSTTLSNSEILAVCKILLESRAFCKSEIEPIIQKLLENCIPKSNRDTVYSLIANELFHYIEPQHRKKYIEKLWDIGAAIREQRVIKISYEKQNGTIVDRTIHPVGIMFSEYYFYLTAFIEDIDKKVAFDNPDDLFPTIYRIDRIQTFVVYERHFDIPYKDRFEEGEFRKRIQFMYGGKLRCVKFWFRGPSVEAVLDRLPTAKVIKQSEENYLISAEVFGNGIDMWLRSQGDAVNVVSDKEC